MKKILVSFVAMVSIFILSSFVTAGWYKCRTCNGTGYPYTRNCSACNGKGKKLNIVNCSRCNGNGYIRDEYGEKKTCPKCDGAKKETYYTTCSSCNGSGEEKMACRTCGGRGEVWVEE